MSLPRNRMWLLLAFVMLCCVVGLCTERTTVAQKKASNLSADKSSQAKDDRSPLSKFMRAKLGATNHVLEGLVVEDFDLITKGAKTLREISSAEKWRISNDPIYRQHSAEFQRKVDQLLQSAKDKNLDVATLAYLDTTMSCIECHKWVRAILITENTQLDLPGLQPKRNLRERFAQLEQ